MKAIVQTRSGPPEVLQLREVEKPTPQDHEVLVKVHAATVTAGDVVLRKLPALMLLPMRLFGVRPRKIPGHEFAGVIEAVGVDVTQFKVGDPVFGTTTGLSTGANAEYVCVPAESKTSVLALKPANLSDEEAAAVPVGGMTALYILIRGGMEHGDRGKKVLIYGASGSVGTYAVQLARYFGAEVTGVCSTANVDLVKSLGAEKVIDYTQEEFTANGETYDVIFDAVGKTSSSQIKGSLRENGHYISIRSSTRESTGDLLLLKAMIEDGKLKPVIDRRYPLEQVAEAHRYVETGRKKGNVVITVAS